jgi:hypothetical protein
MGKYLDIVKRFEARQQESGNARAHVPTLQPRPFIDDGRETAPAAVAWLCPHCGHPATIDDVFPSSDGERTLTMWSCDPCEIVAVTPDAIKEPPSGWVKRVKQ